jgi:hypothetical protein
MISGNRRPGVPGVDVLLVLRAPFEACIEVAAQHDAQLHGTGIRARFMMCLQKQEIVFVCPSEIWLTIRAVRSR